VPAPQRGLRISAKRRKRGLEPGARRALAGPRIVHIEGRTAPGRDLAHGSANTTAARPGGAADGRRATIDWLMSEGLPAPTAEQDAGWDLSTAKCPSLAVGLDEVKELFERYELLDDPVRFLKGWFRDTLPGAPIDRRAVLRLDGNLYESTTDALESLYDRPSPGGFVIIDDYKALAPCEMAVYWRKPRVTH